MSRKVRKNVGVIGLGIIGSRVAAGLRATGYQVYVWNRSAKPAPNFLGSPAEVADSAEIIQIFVADAQALFDVIEAMSEVLSARHVIMCSATVGPEAVLEAAQLVEARGAQFLDAPFTGSKVAAEKRQLVYYVGGAEPAFLRVRPVLELTSKSIIRMGDVGHAATIKVVTNMISAVTAQVLAEALSIVQKAGLEPELLGAAIEQNACRSGVIDLKLPKMMSGDYEPHFSLKHMFKDVQLGIHMANALDIEIPATTVTAGVMYGALNNGWGDLDYSALFKNYTPSEIFEELPALEQVLGTIEPPVEEPAIPQSGLAAELPLAPYVPPVAIEPPVEIAPVEPEPPATTPMEPPLEIPPPSPATAHVAPPTINGNPKRESVPTEEAARIIEAVLAHVSSQRSESGSVPMMAHSHPADAEQSPEAEDMTAAATATVPQPASAQAEGTPPEKDEKKLEPKPVGFVRRWFAGRS